MRPLKPAPDIEWQVFEEESLLINVRSGVFFRLNRVGTFIWRLLSEGATPAAILEELLSHFAVERPEAAADLDRFIASLLDEGLLIQE